MPKGKRFHPLIQAGFVFLVLASGANWLLRPPRMTNQDLADAVKGLLYGLAIGCMLFGLIKSRKDPSAPAPPEA